VTDIWCTVRILNLRRITIEDGMGGSGIFLPFTYYEWRGLTLSGFFPTRARLDFMIEPK